ncbi:endoplasmic reticulum metallopeptidase 1 [Carassius auratus]|uniref:Endoplasmic reticulum metallopeptidase 1 n=1 Tax=Carassius auratus TaxID=7957 RepID=A0A6P6LAQ8_CARAU|nr:endoplasmic reticulum metallopeptidase 1-like [Carassius auratus]XP_026081650.1 endoplasmic reticulum metallopeptidase 1-like [Carassius auratus]
MQIRERDSTGRRNRDQQNQQQWDSRDEEAALNMLWSRKRKPEMRTGLVESSVVILLLGFVCLLWTLVLISVQPLISSSSPGHFNALRARKHLEQITSIGPRTVGSTENEITTVNYLLDQIEQIQSESKTGPHFITVDIQRPTGCFRIDSFNISCYDRITNIAVKLQPKTGAQHFMLANCHFDSVPNSPGASDDAVSCSVMLEVLHSLVNLSMPLKHGVIFLFNGAEETKLQASHGFITQHPWAQQVRAFVNLEAAGVGGKELVFQTGPENPWLVQAYARAAIYPFASVVGQEIFQSRLIPSDTDFRIFRDFGNIPGIDLAFIENGFIYHTKYDTPERIHTKSIQRTGDNILSLLKHLVMSEELADSSKYRSGNMVFFDMLGVMLVVYPAHVGTIINYLVAIATMIYLGTKCMLTRRVDQIFLPSCDMSVLTRNMLCAAGRYICELVCATFMLILSWIFTLLAVMFVALLVKLTGHSMFWYSHFYTAISLYGSVAVGIIVLIHTLAKTRCRSTGRMDLAELFFDVNLLLWCCVLLFLTSRGWCSAYVPMMMVVFPLITKLLLSKHFRARGATLLYSVLYLMGLAVPYIHIMFLIRVIFEVFTPILGRNSSETSPDFTMALLVTMATIILSSYFIHFIYLSRSTKWTLAVLGSVFTLMLVLVCCGLFFPYSADPSSPRPKRLFVQHITRRFHSLNGSLQSSDSGFCINSQDYTGMQHITPHIPQINDNICTRCQDQLPYYGFTSKSWYLPAPEVSPKAPLEFQLLSRQETERGTIKMTFEVKGPSHMSLFLHLHTGASLSGWSFSGRTPGSNLSGMYFIFYTHGLDAAAWNFWFEIQPPKSSDASPDEGLISLAISAHYISGSDGRSEQLESLLKRFPTWVFPASWISTYHMYRY